MGKPPNLKYVAFLRAINVCGQNLVRTDERACLEVLRFRHVSTYRQSEWERTDTDKLTTTIQNAYAGKFRLSS